MKRSGGTTGRDLARSADASEIAETAMILPLFFMIFLAILWFGQGFRIYGTITRAAREGARAAVAPVCTTCAGSNDPSANAWSAVQSAMHRHRPFPSTTTGFPTRMVTRPFLSGGEIIDPFGCTAKLPVMARGTTGTPARKAREKPPFMKGRNLPLRLLCPSGKMSTAAPSFIFAPTLQLPSGLPSGCSCRC